MAQWFWEFLTRPLNCTWKNTYLVKFLAPAEQLCIRTPLIKLCEPEPATIVKTKSHQQISKVSCKFCFECFRSEISLRMHQFICDKKKNPAKSKSHLKDVKVKNLSAKTNIEAIVDKIEDDTNLAKCKKSCCFCEKTFNHSGSLNRHINTFHEGLVNFECNICSKCFTTKGSLQRHICTAHQSNNSNEAKELHKCDLCSSEFALKQTLQRHKRQVHGGRKSFKCQICGKAFHEKWSVLHHMKNVHEKIRHRFQCMLCDKSFCRKNILSTHMKNKH